MRFEIGFILNVRRHVQMTETSGRGLFTSPDARGLMQDASRLLGGEFLPLRRMDALYAILVRLRASYPYPMERPYVRNNEFGRRETVREACEVGSGRILLLMCASDPTKIREMHRFLRVMDGYAVEETGGLRFTYVAATSTNINRLRLGRWNVALRGSGNTAHALPPAPDGLDDRLFPYQVEGVRMLMAGYRLLADEQGLGKCAETLQFVKHGDFRKVVICCPASLKLNWKYETVMWAGYADEEICVLSGSRPPRGFSFPSRMRAAVINYDILSGWLDMLNSVDWDIVVADECHYIQSRKAIRTRSFLSIHARDRLFISGTPFTSRPMQFFTVLNAICPKVFSSEYDYGMLFCDPRKGYKGGIEFKGASNLGLLHDILSDGICIRRLKSDVLPDLPEKMRIAYPIETDRDTLEADADAMAEIAELENLIETRKNPYGPFEYMRQLAYLRKRDAAMQWISDFLESGRKLVVFAVHRRVVSDLMSRFADVSVKIDGSTSDVDRQKAKESFQNDDRVRLFVGNVQAAGVGLTLTAASDAVFLEFDWLASSMLQAEDRVHRIGQRRGVKIWYFCTPGTLDMTLMGIVNRKARVHGKVFDGTDDNMLQILKKDFDAH